MGRKTVKFSREGISQLPNDKPAVYKILTPSGNTCYTGVVKRGRVRERIMGHLGEIPGAKVRIEQMSSVKEAREKEIRTVMREVATSGVSVHVISHKDGWAVRRSGASRASKVYDKRTQAITRARSVAKKASGTLVIHGEDGRIEKKETTVKKSKK